jgi:hypothetical protein
MADFQLEAGEQEQGSWTVNYRPPWGGRYTGKLLVTDRRLLYDAKFDTSVSGVLVDLIDTSLGSQGYLAIPKSRITDVSVGGRSKVVVTLDDGSEHRFDYGVMSAKKIAAAISA